MKDMKVKDLINFLQTCPSDATVYIFDGDEGGWNTIPNNKKADGYPEYHKKKDLNTWGPKPQYAENVVLL